MKTNPATLAAARPALQAFSLMELLTVIAIIGLLAAMLVGLYPLASRKMKESATRAQLNQLVSAIESFKNEFGYYPPDNVVSVVNGFTNVNPYVNQLFYELTGVTVINSGNDQGFTCPTPYHKISSLAAKRAFNTPGFVHASPEGAKLKKGWLTLKEKNYAALDQTPSPDPNAIRLLVVPVDWPKDKFNPATRSAGPTLNPWRYNSSAPTNNLRGFDLWAEFYVGKQLKRIGNWKE